jgi:catechol 2,3-dioxygenase-like lactoylglutathione lyase family enzyme
MIGNVLANKRTQVSAAESVRHEQTTLISASALPAWIKPLRGVTPVFRASGFAFLIFEKTDLQATERFLIDFGFAVAAKTDTELRMRSAGTRPYVYVSRKAAKSRFVGYAFNAREASDLQLLRDKCGAVDSNVADTAGGRAVVMTDPAGFEVHVVYGMQPLEPLPLQREQALPVNTARHTSRVNSPLRPKLEPAQVLELSHCVIQTCDFQRMVDWYMRTLGLIPSDVQYLPDGSPNLAFLRLDLGTTPTDHHTIVIAGGVKNTYMHSAYEVADLDAMGQGQQYLLARGWRHAWGLGRHYIGSQLFDYWFDNDGFEMEHMADTDRYDNTVEPCYSPFDRKSLWMWGQDLQPHMALPKNPIVILGIVRSIFSGALDKKRVKQIAASMSLKPRSWIR